MLSWDHFGTTKGYHQKWPKITIIQHPTSNICIYSSLSISWGWCQCRFEFLCHNRFVEGAFEAGGTDEARPFDYGTWHDHSIHSIQEWRHPPWTGHQQWHHQCLPTSRSMATGNRPRDQQLININQQCATLHVLIWTWCHDATWCRWHSAVWFCVHSWLSWEQSEQSVPREILVPSSSFFIWYMMNHNCNMTQARKISSSVPRR